MNGQAAAGALSSRLGRVAAIAGFLLLVAAPGRGHPLSPALLDIREAADGRAEVIWKTSRTRLTGAGLRPILPSHCQAQTQAVARESADSIVTRWTVSCGVGGLVGHRIGIEGLAAARVDALVRVTLADGHVVSGVARASEPFLEVTARPRPFEVARGYGAIGLDHILSGFDHLLFVFGLLLLVSGLRPLVAAVTAFTAGHSITLALAALGIAKLPSRPIEVLIAVSVFMLAVELARPADASPSWMRRAPWAMAFVFGLLHGLGFAGALAEVGLPSQEIPLALLAFNVGIEVGQILFVAAVLGVWMALGKWRDRLPEWAPQVPIYGLGCLSFFWCLERTAALFY